VINLLGSKAYAAVPLQRRTFGARRRFWQYIQPYLEELRLLKLFELLQKA
jgi:hypothetical protein